MSFWPILTFQASAFDHSATAPHCLEARALDSGGAMRKTAPMKKLAPLLLLLAAAPAPKPTLAPSEIVAAAPASDWVAIAPTDLLVMKLASGKQVIIQLMPAPFSQGWIGNIRKLAAAKWWDGLTINRVQDNYVVQWGEASEKKALPSRLGTVSSDQYETGLEFHYLTIGYSGGGNAQGSAYPKFTPNSNKDAYAIATGFSRGWPLASSMVWPKSAKSMAKLERNPSTMKLWPVHCYAMVGVGRNLSPDTGSGAELYTVIGHAPRHLDRNIALVGRVIEGIEHLSSLPRGTEALGFYKSPQERTAITSIRIGTATADLPSFEYLSTESNSFATYADARANRRDPFFIKPAGGADICNIPVPVRRMK